MKVKCVFPQGGGAYTYEGPDDARVGEWLRPDGTLHGDQVRVCELGSDYDGPLKRATREPTDQFSKCPMCGQGVA